MIQINELKITPLHNLRVAENQNSVCNYVIFAREEKGKWGGGGGRGKQGLVNYYNPRLLTGRWDKFSAVEDTGSSWFLKCCGFRPKKDNLGFLFVPSPVSGLTQGPQSKFESRGMWSGRGGGDGGGGSAELNPSFRFRMWGGPGSMLPVGHREIARKYS